MFNPDIKVAKSKGIDIPILHVYLAGRIAGNCIEKCLGWRQDIIKHYKDYKGKGEAYPISFLCPLNSGESKSVDQKGLTSSIPPNLIYDKDLLSVERADVIVANMEDYFEEDIASYLDDNEVDVRLTQEHLDYYVNGFYKLKEKILNRRENIGTVMEVAWALYLQKPVILIVPERRKEIFIKHPFTRRASVIVTSVEQLVKEKWLNILYKSIAGAEY